MKLRVRIKKLSGTEKVVSVIKIRIIFNKMKTAVYPGTDPITYGHIDVIKKSLKIFDKLIIAN